MGLIFSLGVVAAVILAVFGVWLTALSLSGQARTLTRRLAQAGPPKAEPDAGAPAQGLLDRCADRLLPAIGRGLRAAKAPITAGQLVLGALGLSVLLALGANFAGLPPLLGLALALGGGLVVPGLTISTLARRRRKAFATQMPNAVEIIARSLQAGHPVATAMGVAAEQMPEPIGPEFAVVMREIGYGLDRDTALRHLLKRFPVPELRMFAASLEVTRETGGNLSEVFLNLATAMRAKAQLHRKVAAISAEGRMSFWVVSVLPVAVMAGMSLLNPDYYGEVSHDRLFWPLMSLPPTLWAIGAFAIWRMINFRI